MIIFNKKRTSDINLFLKISVSLDYPNLVSETQINLFLFQQNLSFFSMNSQSFWKFHWLKPSSSLIPKEKTLSNDSFSTNFLTFLWKNLGIINQKFLLWIHVLRHFSQIWLISSKNLAWKFFLHIIRNQTSPVHKTLFSSLIVWKNFIEVWNPSFDEFLKIKDRISYLRLLRDLNSQALILCGLCLDRNRCL